MEKTARLERAIEIFVLITFPIALIVGCAATGVEKTEINRVDDMSMVQNSYNIQELYPLFSSIEEDTVAGDKNADVVVNDESVHDVDNAGSITEVAAIKETGDPVVNKQDTAMMEVTFADNVEPAPTIHSQEMSPTKPVLLALADTSEDVLTLGANSRMALMNDVALRPTYLVFNFDTDSTNVHEYDHFFLKQHASYMKSNPGLVLKISGHTDARGSKIYNEELSQRRANEIARMLVSYGVPESQIEVSGLGEVVAVNDENKWQENRRVELEYIENKMISIR